MIQKIATTLHTVKLAFLRYPLMLICALIFMLVIQEHIRLGSNQNFWLSKTAFTTGLGISLFFALAMIGQRIGRIWLWNGLGVLFLLGFYFFIMPSELGLFTEKYAYILIPIYILSHLGVSVAPFLSKTDDEENFWHYNKTLFIHVFLTAVFTLVLSGGIQLALLAMDHLLGIDWNSTTYFRIFFSVLIFGSALIFSLFHLEGLAKMEKPSQYPTVIQFFTQFILIPLLLLYAGILYLYSFKILWAWQMPRGWVAYLVLAYAVLGILALLLVHPLLGSSSSKSWVNWFRKLFYFSLLPLLILLYTAIGMRINQYGFTEARYFVLLLALWLTGVSLYFILHARPILKLIPITLLMVGTASLVIPYFNPLAVGLRSQKSAIVNILSENQLLESDRIDFSKAISVDIASEVQDKYTYLEARKQQDFLLDKMDSTQRKQVLKTSWNLRNLFTNITRDSTEQANQHQEITARGSVHDIAGFAYLSVLEYQNTVQLGIDTDSLVIKKLLHDENQKFTITNGQDSLDLLPLVAAWTLPYQSTQSRTEVEKIEIPFEFGAYQGKMFFNQIYMNRQDPDQKIKFHFERVVFAFSERR